MVAVENLKLHRMVVVRAFLQGDLEEAIYIGLPDDVKTID